jgi:hypothetical protein
MDMVAWLMAASKLLLVVDSGLVCDNSDYVTFEGDER